MLLQLSRRTRSLSAWRSPSIYGKSSRNYAISSLSQNNVSQAKQKYDLSLSRCKHPLLYRKYTQKVEKPEEQTPEHVDELEMYSAKTLLAILDRVKEVWPVPKVPIPEGWYANWEEWDMLVSIYWTSPEYLMLPQIEMVVNIYHALPGETRPIVYSAGAFIFTFVNRPFEFYLLEYGEGARLFKLSSADGTPLTESSLVELLGSPEKIAFALVQPSKEGDSALQRIMDRDRSVILELKKFLGYVPEHTEIWEQHPKLDKEKLEKMSEEEQLAELSRLMREIEARSPEFKEASEAWDQGLQRSDTPEEAVDPDSVERSIDALGLKDEMKELEGMVDSASDELQKLDKALGSKEEVPESQGSLNVELDEADRDHVRLSVPFKEEQTDGKKKSE